MNKVEEAIFFAIVVAIIAIGLVFMGMGRGESDEDASAQECDSPPCDVPDYQVSEVRENPNEGEEDGTIGDQEVE